LNTPPPSEGCCGSTIELLNERTGELVTSRCKATNRCPRCARRYARETTEMLILDAAGWAPTLYMVLTARAYLTRADTYPHLRHLRRVTRKRWPAIEWFIQVEFTQAGRLHLNLVVKGVDVGEREQLHQVVVSEWCRRVDAEPVGQWSGEIAEAGGLARYLAKQLGHGLKGNQAPPIGWEGHRTSHSRGYFPDGTAQARQEARESLRRQDITRAAAARGHRGPALEQAVEQELAAAAEASWIPYAPHLLKHPGWVLSRREALRGGEPCLDPRNEPADAQSAAWTSTSWSQSASTAEPPPGRTTDSETAPGSAPPAEPSISGSTSLDPCCSADATGGRTAGRQTPGAVRPQSSAGRPDRPPRRMRPGPQSV
jgi:hypothetical protein